MRAVNAIIMGVIIAFLTVCIFPTFTWLTGFISRVNGKTAFIIGFLVNQVSEFSLIIANMAYSWGIFTETMYLVKILKRRFAPEITTWIDDSADF